MITATVQPFEEQPLGQVKESPQARRIAPNTIVKPVAAILGVERGKDPPDRLMALFLDPGRKGGDGRKQFLAGCPTLYKTSSLTTLFPAELETKEIEPTATHKVKSTKSHGTRLVRSNRQSKLSQARSEILHEPPGVLATLKRADKVIRKADEQSSVPASRLEYAFKPQIQDIVKVDVDQKPETQSHLAVCLSPGVSPVRPYRVSQP
jgi:hypothetical protein